MRFVGFDIAYDAVQNVKHLADGGESCCYQGVLDGQTVALKVARPDMDVARKDLENELLILQLLNHPNIVQLVGAGKDPQGQEFVALEFLSGGTLSYRIGTNGPGADRMLPAWAVRKFSMTYDQGLGHAIGIASALAYMHETSIPGAAIVHRDLKSSNLAFDEAGTLKLFDFGLAKILRPRDLAGDTRDRYKMTGLTGSLRYMAPEVALDQPANEKADVYSFSIVCWELLTCRRPFDLHTPEIMYERVIHGSERPWLDPHWPPDLQDLLRSCWSANIDERPSMREVERRLRAIRNP